MRKVILLLLVATLLGCNNVKTYGPDESDKAWSIERSDTMLNYVKGWKVIYNNTYDYCYSKDEDKDGNIKKYYTFATRRDITNGTDTLMAITDGIGWNEWEGRIFYEKRRGISVEDIKRINMSIRSSCDSTFFTFHADSEHLLTAKFRKEKPKEPERPLEDYGLKESDL